VADSGRMVFFINWGAVPAKIAFSLPLDKAPKKVREITTGRQMAAPGMQVRIDAEVPAGGVRVYRIDY